MSAAQQPQPDSQPHQLHAPSWAVFANGLSATIDQALRVVAAGGLREAGMAEHLADTRFRSAVKES